MPWAKVIPVLLDMPAGDLCRRAYHGHPKGCPNYGTRDSCPPAAFPWDLRMFSGADTWVIWNAFPFGAHVEMMRAIHPDWSQRQLECCLYWQGRARKRLRALISEFEVARGRPAALFTVPEAHGVNVTETMRFVGIELEWPPRTVAYQVALAFMPVDREERL